MRSRFRYILIIIAIILASFLLCSVLTNFGSQSTYLNQERQSVHPYNSNSHSNCNIVSLFSREDQENSRRQLNHIPYQEVKNNKAQSGHPVHLTDYLSSLRTAPYDFSTCRMSTCFNYSRCVVGRPIAVHILKSSRYTEMDSERTLGESNLIHRTILEIVKKSKHFEPDPEKACIFLLEDDTLDRDPLSKSFQLDLFNIVNEENKFGMNYLIFNLYSGSWPDYKGDDFAGVHFGAAMIAKASNSISHHRQGFDISLPLFSYLHPKEDTSSDNQSTLVSSTERTYFLTFKGKRYVFGKGSETRNSLYHLENGLDVVLVTTCRHGKKWRESSDSRCSEDELKYDQYDFVDLMKKSKFCLTPRGRRLGSFRYLEALNHGCIPIVLSDGWVKPFDEIVDWSCASIQFPEALLLQVPDMLRDINEDTIEILRNNCRYIYFKYFSSIKKIILTTLSIIEKRLNNQMNI